jgi:hypothetical protein
MDPCGSVSRRCDRACSRTSSAANKTETSGVSGRSCCGKDRVQQHYGKIAISVRRTEGRKSPTKRCTEAIAQEMRRVLIWVLLRGPRPHSRSGGQVLFRIALGFVSLTVAIAQATAQLPSARDTGIASTRLDSVLAMMRRSVGLPLRVEHDLPSQIRLTIRDSLRVTVTVQNTGSEVLGIPIGHPEFKIEAQRIPPDAPAMDDPIAWAKVSFLESPSLYGTHNMDAPSIIIRPGETRPLGQWTAAPLPEGSYWVRACLNVRDLGPGDEPRRAATLGGGIWPMVNWCSATASRVTVAK